MLTHHQPAAILPYAAMKPIVCVGGAELCATQLEMCCRCSGECLLKWGALSLVVGALFAGGVQFWLSEKHYVFSAEELASITTKVLENNRKSSS